MNSEWNKVMKMIQKNEDLIVMKKMYAGEIFSPAYKSISGDNGLKSRNSFVH